VPNVLQSGSLNFLEPPGPAQACNGIAFTGIIFSNMYSELNFCAGFICRSCEISEINRRYCKQLTSIYSVNISSNLQGTHFDYYNLNLISTLSAGDMFQNEHGTLTWHNMLIKSVFVHATDLLLSLCLRGINFIYLKQVREYGRGQCGHGLIRYISNVRDMWNYTYCIYTQLWKRGQ